MWPSWTSDRKLRILQLRGLAAGRTADRRNDATRSDGGSTAPPPGPALLQDQGLNRGDSLDQLILDHLMIPPQLVLRF